MTRRHLLGVAAFVLANALVVNALLAWSVRDSPHRAMSEAVLARKLDALAAADPDLIATGNPGCLMQLRAGVAGAGLRARVVHPVEILDAAYAAGS